MPSATTTTSATLSKKGSNPVETSFEKHQTQHLAPFTIKDLRDAIPAHCFDRSALKSFQYLFVDILVISSFYYAAHLFNTKYSNESSWIVSVLFWNVYWFAQGAVMTGIWVIAHECGHQSFSKWKSLNDSVGWVLHSVLLVPYHSWRISHGIHHKKTSHMGHDQVYVPKLKSQVAGANDIHNAIADSPLSAFLQIVVMLLLGWPMYLATNAWGQDYGKRTNHFEPTSPIFKSSQKWEVILSDIGVVLMTLVLTYYSINYSFMNMIKYYFVPYLWVNFWLVLITYLQHTDIRIPHYRGEEWNYIRGALCTVDRDYGFLNKVFHHIGDTHVTHHLFSLMPHYHAEEATEALKKVLGQYYLVDKTPILTSVWKSWNTCHYVEDEGDILYYKTIGNTKSK